MPRNIDADKLVEILEKSHWKIHTVDEDGFGINEDDFDINELYIHYKGDTYGIFDVIEKIVTADIERRKRAHDLLNGKPMYRITERCDDGVAYVSSETGKEGVGHFTTQRRLPEIISRLAAYEDTGLEPKQIMELLK